jgi:hypothetical protein
MEAIAIGGGQECRTAELDAAGHGVAAAERWRPSRWRCARRWPTNATGPSVTRSAQLGAAGNLRSARLAPIRQRPWATVLIGVATSDLRGLDSHQIANTPRRSLKSANELQRHLCPRQDSNLQRWPSSTPPEQR